MGMYVSEEEEEIVSSGSGVDDDNDDQNSPKGGSFGRILIFMWQRMIRISVG